MDPSTQIINDSMKTLNKKYDNLSYLDKYFGSVLRLFIVTIIVVLLIMYCYISTNSKLIKNDWKNLRCKPYVLPFAGFINKPDNMTIMEYTEENFEFCSREILKEVAGNAVAPLSFVITQLTTSAQKIINSIKAAKLMFTYIIDKLKEIVTQFLRQIMNFVIPLQQIIIGLSDFMGKVQGMMVSQLYTFLGILYVIKSTFGALVQILITLLIVNIAKIAILWALPVTYPFAIINTALVIAGSIPVAMLLAFLIEDLHVPTNLSLPRIKSPNHIKKNKSHLQKFNKSMKKTKIPAVKCFDKNTLIEMNNGEKKKIKDIQLGDLLKNNNAVTSIIKVETKGSKMYELNNVIVSDSHIVKWQERWIPVSNHPNANKILNYNEMFLYCLNTTNKTIELNNTLFTDWDEIYTESLHKIMSHVYSRFYNELRESLNTKNKYNIHKYLDGGFAPDTQIILKNGDIMKIKNIKVGDILEDGEKIYGIVKINGNNLFQQYKYNLGKKTLFEGYFHDNNLINKYKEVDPLTKIKIENQNKHSVLYHLLTYPNYFYISHIKVFDYNSNIDSITK
jgi:hypothetical protein